MSICYYIPVKDELEYLEKSLPNLFTNVGANDMILISIDKDKTPISVRNYLSTFENKKDIAWFREDGVNPPLKIVEFEWCDDFSELKNLAFQYTDKEWIFQLDADENLTKTLIQQINQFLETAKDDGWDVIMIPSINTYSDLEDYPNFIEDNYLHFEFNERGWMHWPEYCLRIYRNLDYIRWVGEIHESIQGCKAHLQIEPSEDYAIIHEKSISKQLISDEYYNTFEHHRNLHQQNLENRKRVVEAKLESIRFNSEQGFEEEYI